MLHDKPVKILKLLNKNELRLDEIPKKLNQNNEINELTQLGYLSYEISEDGEPREPYRISFKGRSYLAEKKQERIRYWQGLLVPQLLNVITAIITAVLTVFVMRYLGL